MKIKRMLVHLRRIIREPIGELSRAQRMLRFVIDLSRHGWRQLSKDNAPQMAAALSYRAIFSLIPVAVLALLVFRAFTELGDVLDGAHQAYEYFGLTALEGLGQKIDELITTAWEFDVRNIGLASGVLFVWAALALLVTIEESLNIIMNCPTGRSWYHRVTTYWAFITLGPAFLFVSFYGAERLVEWSYQARPMGAWTDAMVGVLTRGATLAASWAMLFLLYIFMPNTRVRRRPAALGSFLAAALFEITKWAFRWYVTSAVPYSLWGSLALVPLFLFWMYVIWLIVLFGAEVASILQTLHGRELEDQQTARFKDRILCDPLWLIPMLAQVGRAFVKGKTVTRERLSNQLKLPLSAVIGMADRLQKAGLVHEVGAKHRGHDEPAYALAKPPDEIPLSCVIEVGRTITTNNDRDLDEQPGWDVVSDLVAAQKDSACDLTLAGVLEHSDADVRETG